MRYQKHLNFGKTEHQSTFFSIWDRGGEGSQGCHFPQIREMILEIVSEPKLFLYDLNMIGSFEEEPSLAKTCER